MPDLNEIHRDYLKTIVRTCSRYSRDRHEIEDLVQDTFLRIEKGLASFRGESQIGTWIYRIAVNCCLEHLRKCRRQMAADFGFLDALVVHNLASIGDPILAKVDLNRILGHLRPKVREILFLVLAEGLSYREVSEVAGVSSAAAAKIVERFLKKFRGRKPAIMANSKRPILSIQPQNVEDRELSGDRA